MNHLKRCSASPGAALCEPNAILSIHLGNGIRQASHPPPPPTPSLHRQRQHHPSPKWSRGCLKTLPGAAGPRLGGEEEEGERGGRESAVDLSPPPPALVLASLRFGGAANHRVACLIGAVRRLQWCLSALRWWLTGSKCYGNDIYLPLFDPAHSKQPGPVSFPCPG